MMLKRSALIMPQQEAALSFGRKDTMNPQTKKVSAQTEEARGRVVLLFSIRNEFLDHYQGIFLKLGFTPIRATTVEAALAILRLVVVVFIVVDQDSGIPIGRKILQRAHEAQPDALALVVSEKPDPRFRREAQALGVSEYLKHPAIPENFARVLRLVQEGMRQ